MRRETPLALGDDPLHGICAWAIGGRDSHSPTAPEVDTDAGVR
jgi:hypothetical protein